MAKTEHKDISMAGKFYTTDPAVIGENFQTLTNLRYKDSHKEGVGGMAKINVTALTTCVETKSAFHFKKSQPQESHVIAQVQTTAGDSSRLMQHEAVVPGTAAFTATALWTDSSGFGVGRFSDAPDGQMIYANGVDACIWGGDEMRVGAFLTSTAAVTDTGSATSPRDYTDVVNNTKTDGNNVAIIGGGIDSDTVLMLHCDGADTSTTFTDSSDSGHVVTANGDAQIDISHSKFGTGSGLFDGTGDYLSVPDHANWNFSTDEVTIDTWVRFSSVTGQMCFYSQGVNTSYVAFFQDHDNSLLWFAVMSAGTRVVLESATWAPSADVWYHVAVIRGWGGSANAWAFVVDGTSIGTFTNAGTLPDIAAVIQAGNMSTSTLIDFGNTGHGFTVGGGNPITSGTEEKFGSGSLYLTDDSLYAATSTDFDIKTNWTISLFVKHDDHAGSEVYVVHIEDVNNRWYLYHDHGNGLKFVVDSLGGTIVDTGFGGEITDTDWHHVALCKVGDDYGIYLDGTQVCHTNDADTDTFTGNLFLGSNNGADNFYSGYMDDVVLYNGNLFSAAPVGGLTDTITVPTATHTPDANTLLLLRLDALGFAGWMDEYRVSKDVARWTENFTPPTRPYFPTALTWLVGSVRPLKGCKYYVSTGNGLASTMTGKVWTGTTWQTMTLTDNTDTGASLATTGTVTFATTVDIAKPKYLEGYFLYWYQFSIDAGGAEIYSVTVDAPFQNIVDMWDGIYRSAVRFYKYTTAYLDNTINVLEDDYYSTTTTTYSDLSSMGAFSAPNNCLEIGFDEKMTGLRFVIAPDYTNSTAATTMAIDYWDGSTYSSLGTVTDGTSEGAIAFAKSGVASWSNNSLSNETRKVVSNSPPLYYYRVRFDKAMDASVRLSYVGGISAQKEISHYKFPVFAQGRVLLCVESAGVKNKAVASSKYLPQVYNGVDSVNIYFGEEGELTCGTELFSQFGSNLYSLVLMFKDHETWIMAGQDIDSWNDNIFLLSSSIGCPAPLTLETINLAAQPGAGTNRALAIWQDANGVFMSDGRAPIPIHGDIKEYFDRNDSRCIKDSMIGDSVAFVDPVRHEYHLLLASGTSATTLNTELVYDIVANAWFEIDRSSDLQCGVLVHDTDGNAYNYGFLDTGYMERLEYGNDFDGTDITHTFQFGDMAFKGFGVGTRLSSVRLIAKQKTTDGSVTLTHYADGATTGTSKTMSITKADHRIAMPTLEERFDGDPFHSLKFEITTDDAVPGFEPIAVVAAYHQTQMDR